jgi:hypothetical protein
VTAVSIGARLGVTVRRDRLFRPWPLGGFRLDDVPWRHPVEFTTSDRVPRKPRGYRIHVWYGLGPSPAPADTDDFATIVRGGLYPEIAATSSMPLLAAWDALCIDRW